MAHTCSNLLVHLVFSTKGRRPVIGADMKGEVCAYLGGIVREMRGAALIANGTADHIHLLIRVPAVHAVAEVVRILKSNSSKWIHQRWPDREFAWQTGYGAFAVSESNVRAVSKYIAEQEAHHQKRSFQDEFREFLKKNGIVVDEQYLWD
jgi:REP element-mobilizing transposase RayT